MDNFNITPVSTALGAIITGLDFTKNISDETKQAINDAFLKYSVLIFKEQSLEIEDLKRFARLFGKLSVHEHVLPLTIKGHPECAHLHFNETFRQNANVWHTDSSGLKCPSLATILYGKLIPEIGGDTLFSNMYMAYDALSKPMQDFLKNLYAVHDYKKAYCDDTAAKKALESKGVDMKEFETREAISHPVVIKHPITHKKAIYISTPYVTRIKELSNKESDLILNFLYDHITKVEFIYRHRWSQNDLVVWDNRCLQHYGVADFYPQERTMIRLNTDGEALISA